MFSLVTVLPVLAVAVCIYLLTEFTLLGMWLVSGFTKIYFFFPFSTVGQAAPSGPSPSGIFLSAPLDFPQPLTIT